MRSRNGPEARFRSVKIRANLQPRVCLTDACGNFRSTWLVEQKLIKRYDFIFGAVN